MAREAAAAMLEEGGIQMEGHEIVSAYLDDNSLRLNLSGGYPDGRYCLVFNARTKVDDETGEEIVVLDVDFDEPEGAGADPFGRPDPSTHPEYWTE